MGGRKPSQQNRRRVELQADRVWEAGYRQYDESTAERLRLIKGAQRLGLRLREIAELLAVRNRGACPCGHTQAFIQCRLAEIDAEIARQLELRRELRRVAAECAADACAEPDGAWSCEVQFVDAAKEVSRP
jgi:DNA-binding transcriptional MerR regulator